MTFRCYKGLSNSERTKLKCEAKKSGKKVRPLGIETIYDDRTGKIIEQGVFQVEALKGPIWVASNPEVLEPFKNILKYKFGPRPEFDNIAYIEQRFSEKKNPHTNVYGSDGRIIAFYGNDGWKLSSGVASHQNQFEREDNGPKTI